MLRPRRTSFPESPRAIYTQQKCVSKARKNSTPWVWNCGSRRPKFGPQIWAQTRVHAAQKQCRRVGPLRSSAYLAAPKTSREKGPIFGHARRRHGAGKRVHFGSPHRFLEFTSRRFSQPPISTPQQLSSGLRYTHCDANLGNFHRSISLKPLPQQGGTSTTHIQRASKVEDCHRGGPLRSNRF